MTLQTRLQFALGPSCDSLALAVNLAREFHQRTDAFPCHRFGSTQRGLHLLEQRSIPVLFQPGPATFGRVILAVARRIVNQVQPQPAGVGEILQPGEELCAACVALRPVVCVEHEFFHPWISRPAPPPPTLQAICQQVALVLAGLLAKCKSNWPLSTSRMPTGMSFSLSGAMPRSCAATGFWPRALPRRLYSPKNTVAFVSRLKRKLLGSASACALAARTLAKRASHSLVFFGFGFGHGPQPLSQPVEQAA
jgi:hypothetical protein